MTNRWWKSAQIAVLSAMILLPQATLSAKPGHGRNNKAEKQAKHEMKQEQKAASYEFDRYKNMNVYYNRTTATYYWIDSGRWYEGRSLPGHITVGGECERFRIGAPTPYEYHRMNYERLPYAYGKKNFGKRRGPPDHAPAWGHRRKFGYVYYPDRDIYYDPYEKQYAWIEAGKMKIGYELPDWIKVDPYGGVHVELERAVKLEDFKKIFR
ncbi:MAG TPA: hypothetical protein VIV61_03595 [Candidatus Ozemobacteraceae bacterium]